MSVPDPVALIRDTLDAQGYAPHGPERSFTALCPAHEDHNPSLSVGSGSDGRALVNCFAGCATEDVLGELGLSLSDLFPTGFSGDLRVVERTIGPAPDMPRSLNGSGPSEPFALKLGEFIQAHGDTMPALLGDTDDVLLPVAGFLILGGRGGKGKTTLTIDGAFHSISGIDWLGYPIPRALNVMIIENEGTREMFRRKLERKKANWAHEIHGELFVYTLDWGAFDVRDQQKRELLKTFVDEHQVDVVIADPLDSCGLVGVGSPENTREFMDFCKAIGLHRSVAFWFLHHPRKEKTDDELEDLSGAWGGKPDTVMMLSVLAGDRSRLAIPKMRHGKRGKGPTLILKFDVDSEGFERVAVEGEERDYADEIAELLADGKPRTVDEIKDQIAASHAKVKATLEGDERFISKPGGEAGRHKNAIVWGLA